MSYLQQHLNEIEAEAAEKSRLACANAALIELAGEVMAQINAAAERDVVFATYHLHDPSRSGVTIQCLEADGQMAAAALVAAGYDLTGPRRTFGGAVFFAIDPQIDVRLPTPDPDRYRVPPFAGRGNHLDEPLPCAA